MAETPPITLSLTGKLFIQFPGHELIEVGAVTLPFTAAVIAQAAPSCSACEGVVVLDGRPMYCEACGQGIKQTSSDAGGS